MKSIFGVLTTLASFGILTAGVVGCNNQTNSSSNSPKKSESASDLSGGDQKDIVKKDDELKVDDPKSKYDGDYTQWGVTSMRNNVRRGVNVPTTWDVGEFDEDTDAWDSTSAKNIKWVARLGSQSYGNPIVSDGQVFVGTNNGGGWLKRYPAKVDLGCMLCFRESDGKFLWQHSSEKLSTGRVHDWPLQGICSTPIVQGNRMWFVTSRGEVACLDVEGFHDGKNDGAYQEERARLFAGAAGLSKGLDDGTISAELKKAMTDAKLEWANDAKVTTVTKGQIWSIDAQLDGKKVQLSLRAEGGKLHVFRLLTPDDQDEADTIWSFNMMKRLGVSQHNMASCSFTISGDILFVCTSNGVDAQHNSCPAPKAPSFLAMDKISGEVLWSDNSPGKFVVHGQWSSPTFAVLGGVPQVLFAGGDGWIYSFRGEKTKDGKPELLWKFDCNLKESLWEVLGTGSRNNIIATPVVYDGLVYVAVGQDPEHGEGEGHLWCIDPTKRGDVSTELAFSREEVLKPEAERKPLPRRRMQAVDKTKGEVAVPNKNSALVWHYNGFDLNGDKELQFEEQMHRSCGTVAIKDNILFVADFSGLVHCLNAKTGKLNFTHDMFAASWGSPLIVDGKVYIGDEDGDIAIFKLSEKKNLITEEINMGSSVYSTPIIANNVLFISSKNRLFAIEQQGEVGTDQEDEEKVID